MDHGPFDVIVIGAGPAGEVVAGALGEAGKAVAIVENRLVGGECSYWACMPSKALLRPGELHDEIPRVPGVAKANGVDAARVLERRDEVIHHLADDTQLPWLDDRGIVLVRGHGRLDGEKRVRVDDQDEVLEAREAVVVAVGSAPAVPPISGLREADPWTNREGTTAQEVPRRLAILGGGVVGVELAQAWRSLGAEVTIVEALDRILPNVEPVASSEVAASLRDRGVQLRLGAKASEVEHADGEVTLHLEDGTSVRADRLLVAIGRRPLTDDLGLESVGLEAGQPIEVDDAMRVSDRPWLYVVGDANGRALLTHMGKYQARVATRRILGDEEVRVEVNGALSPQVIFTDPQVSAVGHTLASAREAGIDAEVIDLTTSATAGASFYGRNTDGTTRFVLDTRREVLVGATFVGFETAEFVHAAAIAIAGEVPLSRLFHAVPSFPTRSEIWLKLADAYRRSSS